MSRRAFQLLIVIKWLLVPLIVAATLWAERYLPPELSGYMQARRNAEPTGSEWAWLVAAVIFMIFSLTVSVGLFRFSRWAKRLLLPSYIVGLLILLFSEPAVGSGLESALLYTGSVIDGVILALVYYSPISEMFEAGGSG